MTEQNTKKTEKKKTVAKKKIELKNIDVAYAVLVEPWITEKTHSAIAQNKYTFKVTRDSNKKQVKKAIEGLYGVIVEKVSVVNIAAKKRNFGRHTSLTSAFKKATVTIKQGQSIEIFRGA